MTKARMNKNVKPKMNLKTYKIRVCRWSTFWRKKNLNNYYFPLIFPFITLHACIFFEIIPSSFSFFFPFSPFTSFGQLWLRWKVVVAILNWCTWSDLKKCRYHSVVCPYSVISSENMKQSIVFTLVTEVISFAPCPVVHKLDCEAN